MQYFIRQTFSTDARNKANIFMTLQEEEEEEEEESDCYEQVFIWCVSIWSDDTSGFKMDKGALPAAGREWRLQHMLYRAGIVATSMLSSHDLMRSRMYV